MIGELHLRVIGEEERRGRGLARRANARVGPAGEPGSARRCAGLWAGRAAFVAVTVLAAVAGVGLLGCNRVRPLHVIAPPAASLAFAVLYDGPSVAQIGPVIRPEAIALGQYGLESSKGDLQARLFFLTLGDLQASAAAGCAMLGDTIERLACLERVAGCSADPISCLAVHPAGQGCADRLPLPASLPVAVYGDAGHGELTAAANPAASLAALELCGPSIQRQCPLRLAGFVLSEGGRFSCVAPARQVDCDLTIDGADCGLGAIHGRLTATGAFPGVVATSSCTLGPLAASEAGANPAGFAIACGSRRLVARYMETILGAAGCPRRVPAAFEEALAEDSGAGGPPTYASITGLKAIQPSGWPTRYVITGTGFDACSFDACAHPGSSCAMSCGQDCDGNLSLGDCQNRNLWATCTGGTAHDECVHRCVASCGKDQLECLRVSSGHTLAVTSTVTPERDVARVDLDGMTATAQPITGHQALAVLGVPDRPLLVVAGLYGVRAFTARGPDLLGPGPQLGVPASAHAAGVVPVPGTVDRAVLYGQIAGSPPIGFFEVLQLSASSSAAAALHLVRVDELGAVDALAIGGPELDLAVAASSGATTLAVHPLAGGPGPAAPSLRGPATALGSLPRGAIAAAVSLGPGRAEVAILPPGDGGFGAPIELELLGGLRATAFVVDPATCTASADTCRVFVGLERGGGVEGAGDALVGVVEYHPAAPERSRMSPSYIKTTAPELTTLEYDPVANQLVAAASTLGRITQIMLFR